MTKKQKIKDIVYEIGLVIFGSVMFSLAMNMFLLPANIILGGMTGIATVLNILFNTPVGLMIIVLNIPLFVANTFAFGTRFLRRTLIGVVATSVATDVLTFFPATTEDPLICAILGGITMGAGVGVMMTRGYTTGGTDLIACLLRIKLKNVSMGTIIMITDIMIIVGAAFVTGDYTSIFYSVICAFSAGRVLDMMISGSRRAGQAFIVTDKPDEIVKLIFKRLDRGVTVLEGTGAYTGEAKKVIMCVLGRGQVFMLKKLVAQCDERAFVVISDVSEVTGEGFHNHAAGEADK